ncbi:hypothetical protein BDV93DRAFT_587771 [Ceratobasidium sp. AG-I]|nr:hypothetical protein BDV93DRAFT_587771 [Ceratobasidium sp. AG-I]
MVAPAGDIARGINRPDYLDSLGMYLMKRYEVSGQVEDINHAVEYFSQAVVLTPDGHAKVPGRLNRLGLSHQHRFERVGELRDMDRAIACQSQAVLLTPDGHAERPGMLNNLGLSHQSRFQHLGDLADIDRAIACQSQVVLLTPDGHADKPGRLSNLGSSHLCRFQRLGDLAEIDRAIVCQYQAVLLTPDGHADKPSALNNLGNCHLCRFEHLGDLAEINRAIACQYKAVLLTPDGHAGKLGRLNNLGSSHLFRFKHLGDLADIDRAIACQSQAVLLIPDSHANKPRMLSNIGSSHQSRFKHLGDLADIDRAIACQSQAVLLTPDDGHADRPRALSSLGSSHQSRFQHLRDLADIDRAIACQSQAVLLTPDGHADKPRMLSNLGISHQCRFEHLGDLADVDRTIACQSQAVLLSPDGYAGKPGMLNNLGLSHLSRFKHLGDLADIDRAIACQYQAVLLTPDGHADKPGTLNNLGNSHLCRFQHLGVLADIDRVLASLRMAAHCSTGESAIRFHASRQWARLSVKFDPSSSLSAYQWTMDMVPKVVWIGSTISHRYEDIHSIGDLAVEAAAVAISAQEYGLALEWLEAGRSVVWNQTLQLRNQFDDLSTVDPDLATSLRNTAVALEHAGSWSSDSAFLVDSYTLESTAQSHRRLAESFERLLSRARKISSFHDFMCPKRTAELMAASRHGPVVVINVHKGRCDALILHPHTDEITHVPLPNVSHMSLVDLQCHMWELTSRGIAERRPEFHQEAPEEPLESILSALWHSIVKVVLNSMGYAKRLPVDQLPHITWCTTGVLAMLPIHAAGCYDETGDNLFAYAISSYAPTLTSLISSDPHLLELGGILAVSQEATLPETKNELAHIKRCLGRLPYLQLENSEATAEAVLDAMEQFKSVHFACHASQNLKHPLRSCFHLHDRGLSLADITKRSLKDKGLAFLSACQTATGDDKSPDEAIHLAAGMLVAGYQTVIATMWSIRDVDAPLVADSIYSQISKDGRLDGGRVARALHAAVATLRDQVGEKAFVRWVPYIHMGV